MTTPALNITIDTQEPRIATDRLGLLVTGAVNDRLQWDLANSFNVFCDPVTYTLFLLPYQFTAEWDTTTSGVYARQRKSMTDKAADSSWIEHIPNGVAGNVYLMGLGTNAAVTTLASWQKNQAWWFSYFAFGQGETFEQLRITWGTVVCSVYSDGTVQVLKNGLQVGSGNLGRLKSIDAPHSAQGKGSQGSDKAQQTNVPVSFVVIPCRHRELLFLSSRGGGFRVCFEDITPEDPDPVILPAGQMTWQVPNGKPLVQYAPLTHFTSGYGVSFAQEFREAPVAAATATMNVYYDKPGHGFPVTATGSLKQTDGTTAFVGDGSRTQAKVRVDLTGDGSNTPWVYGASAIMSAVTANTDSAHSQSLDAFSLDMQLTVPESPAGVTCRITCNNTDDLDALVAKSKRVGNRPIECKIGSIAFLTGRTKAPRFEDSVVQGAAHLIWECQDRWKANETYEILDPLPFDKRRLKSVMEELARLPGYSSADMDVEDFDLTIDGQGQSSNGEWGTIPESGDTSAKWLLQLWQDYAQTAYIGWYPSATGPKFRFRSPESIGTTADATLYFTRADAISAGYTDDGTGLGYWWQHVVTSYHEDDLECEANDIRVTGWDSGIDKAFQAHYRDDASCLAITVPASRPDNWLGEARRVALFNPAIKTAAVATYANGVLRKRLVPIRRLAEIECEMQFKADSAPAWRGNVLALNGLGRFRVQTLSGGSLIEHQSTGAGDPDRMIRPYKYALEYIGA